MPQNDISSSSGACFLCGSDDYRVVFETSPFKTVKCSSCGLVRVTPMPDDKQRKEINDFTYSTDEYKDRYFKDSGNFKRWFREKLKIIEQYKPAKGRILDIGCSYGLFVGEALKKGWDAYGCEINPVTSSYAKNLFKERIHAGTLESMPFKAVGFDVITLWDVIEHQTAPLKFIEDVKQYLKPGGLLCLQVPNFDSRIARMKGADWDWLTPGDHLYFFTPQTFTKTLDKAGFSPVYLKTWEPVRYFIDSMIGFNENKNTLLELYRLTLLRFIRLFLFFIFMPYQRYLHSRNKGALILAVTARTEEANV